MQDVRVFDFNFVFVSKGTCQRKLNPRVQMTDLVKLGVGELALSYQPTQALVGEVLPAGTSCEYRCPCSYERHEGGPRCSFAQSGRNLWDRQHFGAHNCLTRERTAKLRLAPISLCEVVGRSIAFANPARRRCGAGGYRGFQLFWRKQFAGPTLVM